MCTYIQMLIFQICAFCCCRYKLLLYSVHCSYIPAIRFYPHISWNSVPPEMHCYQDSQIFPFLTPHNQKWPQAINYFNSVKLKTTFSLIFVRRAIVPKFIVRYNPFHHLLRINEIDNLSP